MCFSVWCCDVPHRQACSVFLLPVAELKERRGFIVTANVKLPLDMWNVVANNNDDNNNNVNGVDDNNNEDNIDPQILYIYYLYYKVTLGYAWMFPKWARNIIEVWTLFKVGRFFLRYLWSVTDSVTLGLFLITGSVLFYPTRLLPHELTNTGPLFGPRERRLALGRYTSHRNHSIRSKDFGRTDGHVGWIVYSRKILWTPI